MKCLAFVNEAYAFNLGDAVDQLLILLWRNDNNSTTLRLPHRNDARSTVFETHLARFPQYRYLKEGLAAEMLSETCKGVSKTVLLASFL